MTLTGIGGSLGIGVTQPTKTLHVNGDAFVDGSISRLLTFLKTKIQND